MRLSASLAYATLFSIIPLLSLLVTIGVLLNIDFTNQLYAQLEPIVGSKVIDALQAIMENAETTDSFSFATIISIGVTIFGATTVFAEIQSSLNTIWGIKAVPKKSWLKYIINRLLSFSVILAFAFILLITFTITNLITDISNKFITNNPDIAESLVKTIGMIINIGVTTVIFTLIFKILPDAKIKSKDVIIGALVTTVLLLIGQWGISFYIGFANIETVYGAAAFMAIFITLKSATKLFSVLLASKRPLITELADKLRLKYPLLPTISPCPTMRLEAIRSIIPISCRRYPKSV